MAAILQELIYDSLREGAVWPFDRRYIRPPHFHGQVELLLIRSGQATLRLGTRAEVVRARQLCWVLPGVPHVMVGFSDDFDMWVVELDAEVAGASWRAMTCAPEFCGATTDSPFSGWAAALGDQLAGRSTVEVGAEDMRGLAALASHVWVTESPDEARGALRALCDRALRISLPSADVRREASVGQLASCLLLASPLLDREAVAAELGVSTGFLSRTFHRDLGVTFVEHRARTRVAHFLALVHDARRNLLSAALDAGFGSYSQFHRIFTRVSGSRPSDYLAGGRRRAQLLIASDAGDPDAGPPREVPGARRHLARLDA